MSTKANVKAIIEAKDEEIFRLREEIGALNRQCFQLLQREKELKEEICATKRKYGCLLERHIEMMERKVRDDQRETD